MNGHHRLNLARRCHVPQVAVRYIGAPDHRAARATGALINLAEGQGEAVDFAKVLRGGDLDLPALKKQGIMPKAQLVTEALALAALHDDAFSLVVAGKLPVSSGVLIGNLKDHGHQRELVRLRAQLNWNDALLSEAVQIVHEAGLIEGEHGRQGSLLPDDNTGVTDLCARLAVRAAVRARLHSQRNALVVALRPTSRKWLTQAGCTVDIGEAKEQRTTADQLI